MRSRIEIDAEYRAGPGVAPGQGRTVVRSIRAGHHFAARETGPGVVHLVGTAAGPLGGDDASIVVRLGPGARLTIRSAGATLSKPMVLAAQWMIGSTRGDAMPNASSRLTQRHSWCSGRPSSGRTGSVTVSQVVCAT